MIELYDYQIELMLYDWVDVEWQRQRVAVTMKRPREEQGDDYHASSADKGHEEEATEDWLSCIL